MVQQQQQQQQQQHIWHFCPPYLDDSMMQKWQQWICFCLVSQQAAGEFATFPKSGECRESRGLQGLSLSRYSYREMRDLHRWGFPKIGVPHLSSIFIRFSMINNPFGVSPFMETTRLPMITHDYPIYGNFKTGNMKINRQFKTNSRVANFRTATFPELWWKTTPKNTRLFFRRQESLQISTRSTKHAVWKCVFCMFSLRIPFFS